MKVRHKQTGEVFDAIKKVSYMVDDGNNLYSRGYDEEFIEVLDEPKAKGIDWEERRYEIAKECMAVLCYTNTPEGGYERKAQAEEAFYLADALIEELKKRK